MNRARETKEALEIVAMCVAFLFIAIFILGKKKNKK